VTAGGVGGWRASRSWKERAPGTAAAASGRARLRNTLPEEAPPHRLLEGGQVLAHAGEDDVLDLDARLLHLVVADVLADRMRAPRR